LKIDISRARPKRGVNFNPAAILMSLESARTNIREHLLESTLVIQGVCHQDFRDVALPLP
jgi:hypothetical protein